MIRLHLLPAQTRSVGLTEQAAKDQKYDIRVGHFPFIGNAKAVALGEDQGMVKTIFDKKTGQLLGAHMSAPGERGSSGLRVAMKSGDHRRELMHPSSRIRAVGDDEGVGARCLWPRPEHVTPHRFLKFSCDHRHPHALFASASAGDRFGVAEALAARSVGRNAITNLSRAAAVS